ncbi:hypothetical protein BB8028_0006g07930 [Beauveria bassiana]|uniref:Uncharacterized protein n=1 Tax=Beauveria bassiana TaxID=176275 RepID=A0A2S7YKD9_BEABA|nr:hypothetical protein BB8028_0006g07930 [Beauveria bassiana]
MPLKNPSLAALQQSRSRFCEGSMNDRASAAPPVHFLGPDALAALEQPASNPRPSHETSNSSGSGAWSRKTGSRLFGQVWEGVRGKLRLRPRDTAAADGPDAKKMTMTSSTMPAPAAVISAATTTTAVTVTNAQQHQQQHQQQHISIYTDPAERDNHNDGPPASRTRSRLTAAPIDVPGATAAGFQFTGFQSARPSREEVLASYQQLMADGFFQANAIPSSRHGRPGSSLPARPATSHHQPPPPPSSPPPQWPLTTPYHHHHHQGFASCPVQSPTSVSSRGTKRAAAPDSDSDESMHDDGDSSSSYKENQAPPHPNTVHDDRQPKKRLRRLPSRESLFVPKIRGSSSSSSSATSSTAASSTAASSSSSSFRRRLTPSYGGPPANKLQKRRPQPQSQPQWQGSSSSRSGVAVVRPRHVSDGGGSARVLRGCAAEAHRPMRVVPDEGRGIPSVPVIPARFTFGEDRQNNGPWRGLRVR